ITGTEVTGWAQGIKSDNLAAGAKIEIRKSWINGNTLYGIQNGAGAAIDAILNYWGDTSGPNHTVTNTGGLGNSVSDNVSYNPWHQDEDFVSLSNGTVYNETQSKYYQSIQTAIDEASAGDTILVAQGIYHEDVVVTKSLTLRGDCGDPDVAGPGSNAPILDGSSAHYNNTKTGFQIRCAGNVVIEGFEIRNYEENGLDLHTGFGNGDNVIFRYNHVHDVKAEGVKGYNGVGVTSGWEVTHNIIERVATGQFGYYGIQLCNVGQSEISNNIVKVDKLSAVAIRIGAARNVGETPVENILISNNTITGTAKPLGFGSDDSPDKSALRDITIVDNVINTSSDIVGEGMAQISGTGVFSRNQVKATTVDALGLQFYYWNGRTVEWTIEDNYLDGNSVAGSGIYFWNPSSLVSAKFHINDNVITGWNNGYMAAGTGVESVLRSNCFIVSNRAILSDVASVDARYNYWGHESGPNYGDKNPGGLGGIAYGPDVRFTPWYRDEACTISSDQDVMDQAQVDAVFDKVPQTIASVVVSSGDEATAEAKRAAVKAHIENLEGIAALGVTVTVEDGTINGYKITISKGSAIPKVKDNVQVTAFVVPPEDQASAAAVATKIDGLPLAVNLSFENFLDSLAAIEEAEAEYQTLTEPQKALVNSYLVDKLNDTVTKIELLILEEMDNRISTAMEELNFAGTGIGGAQLVERKATLSIDDADKKVHEFVQSGVVQLFQSMFTDVEKMKLGDDPTWYDVEGTADVAIEAGAHIVSVLLGLPYEYGKPFGGVFSDLAVAKMGGLSGKRLSIEVKIERLEGGKQYSGTYVIEFKEDVEITGYDAIADIDGGKEGAATYATVELAIAALPETVTITGTADTVPVTWSVDSAPTYATTAGTYVFTGTVGALPEGYVDAVETIATVTASVVIGAADEDTLSKAEGKEGIDNNLEIFTMGTETLEEETPVNEEILDITPIDTAIEAAKVAKEGITVSEDEIDVPAGTYWVAQADMDALDEAIAAAEAAKESAETQQDVAEAVEALEAAVSTFNDAKQEVIDEEEIGVPGEGEESVQAEEPAEDEKSVEDEEAVEGEEQEE
ncbi:MAG: right-handed parallel beta-helix repeat-containing protein, partial [Sphaerochaetaceae bacterium]